MFITPPKERLIVQQLRDFIDTDEENSIALVSGMRKVGKTTALMQLKDSYDNAALYVDLSVDADKFEDVLDGFIDSKATILLLDEISYMREYEITLQSLYNLANNKDTKDFKLIITGSSSAHLTRLADSKLGGRAVIYRLPVVTFIEYLYFTGKIPDYSGYSQATAEDFSDYLQLKGLKELTIQFDDRYFDAYYKEVEMGNRKRGLSHSLVNLKSGDLQNMARLIAYKLSEPKVHKGVFEPEVGHQERGSLRGLTPPVRFQRGYDLSDAMIADSAKHVKGVSAQDKGRILAFMLNAGLACAEFTDTGSDSDVKDIGYVLNVLENCTTDGQLINLIDVDKVSICLTTPLFYTRLGADILTRAGVDVSNLCKGSLLGNMYEVYIRGAAILRSADSVMSSIKLRHTGIGEVDLCDYRKELLLEATIASKSAVDVRVQKYFKDTNFIRVCATNSQSYFDGEFYRVTYPILACMFDNGEIYDLSPTTAWTDEQREAHNENFNTAKKPADTTDDIVLAFVNNSNNQRIGLNVWRHNTRQTEMIPLPSDFKSWNLDIVRNRLCPKVCYIRDFPVLTPIDEETGISEISRYKVKGSGAWVIGVYTDGRLRLMSPKGLLKDVQTETAQPFEEKYKLANADFVEAKGTFAGKLVRLERIE